jgi:hypothetical protein
VSQPSHPQIPGKFGLLFDVEAVEKSLKGQNPSALRAQDATLATNDIATASKRLDLLPATRPRVLEEAFRKYAGRWCSTFGSARLQSGIVRRRRISITGAIKKTRQPDAASLKH